MKMKMFCCLLKDELILKDHTHTEIGKEISSRRQIVETAFSCITSLLPRYIKAHTEQGFLIRIMAAILSYCMSLMIV